MLPRFCSRSFWSGSLFFPVSVPLFILVSYNGDVGCRVSLIKEYKCVILYVQSIEYLDISSLSLLKFVRRQVYFY